jgi:hypothetical protein
MPIYYNKKKYSSDFEKEDFNWVLAQITDSTQEYYNGMKIIGVLLHDDNFLVNGVLFDKKEFVVLETNEELAKKFMDGVEKENVSKNVEMIYIGDSFYYESDTMMSPVYIKTGSYFKRSDWGKVQMMLDAGCTLTMRPATKDELSHFTEELEKYKTRKAAKERLSLSERRL